MKHFRNARRADSRCKMRRLFLPIEMHLLWFRRLRLLIALLLAILSASVMPTAKAQTTIFVSRHADREAPEPDPPLTAKGRCQAEALAALLADANIRHIYTTDLIRTQQTAAPTARQSGVAPVIVAQTDFDGLITHVRATSKAGEATLIVGHRATVPRIVKALSGQDISPLGSSEYTRLMMITIFPDGRTSVVTLRQGGKCEP